MGLIDDITPPLWSDLLKEFEERHEVKNAGYKIGFHKVNGRYVDDAYEDYKRQMDEACPDIVNVRKTKTGSRKVIRSKRIY